MVKKDKIIKTKSKNSITIRQVIEFLESKTLSPEERILAFNHLNKSLNTFPLNDVILFRKDGALLYNGLALSLEQVQNFKQSVTTLKDNAAFRIIGDQILFKAIQTGIHLGHSTDQIIFSKAAVWFIQQFKEQIELFDKLPNQ